MALSIAQLSNFTSPPPKLPQWSKAISPSSLPVIKPRLRKRFHIATLTCKKSSDGSLLTINRNKGETDLEMERGRKFFPPGFIFGAGSSAYQIEGGANEGGRGPSIWDTFSHEQPGGTTGDIACDSYHRYKEDVKLLKEAGMDSYRFSISWSRILPKGSMKGGINQEGIQYYNNLINELLENGIKPFVTLFHWDTPQALEDEYGSFLNHKIVDDFKDFSQICYQEFGDRVKYWITFNEPSTFVSFGYDKGTHAPGRCSKSQGCLVGDSAREPYVASHNLILAHAVAVKLYREKFQATQKGEIGITLNTEWIKPFSDSKKDIEAAERQLDFAYGWYLDPLVYGDYPFTMKAIVKDRLPSFTDEESNMIKGSYDFIGVNYYTASYASSRPISANDLAVSYTKDSYVDLKAEKEGIPIGKPTGTWLYEYPDGIRDLLVYTQKKYNNPPIYITENGTCQLECKVPNLVDALHDKDRIWYYGQHLAKVREAIKLKVNVKGYFAWCLMDNYEWTSGYTVRFGLAYVDYKDNLKRYPKASLRWFSKILKS